MADADSSINKKADAVTRWYEEAVRPFLEEHSKEQLPQLDDEQRRLKSLLGRAEETVVCLVGVSGIGKSTLLNALVAQDKTIAPSGGVGPLTALATEVRYSEVPRLRAEYHAKTHLWRVAAALNFQVARERKIEDDLEAGEASPPLEESDKEQIAEEVAAAADPENEGARRRMDEFVRSARLMVAGSQNEQRPLDYLADALATACSVKPRWGSEISADDQKRIAAIREALQMAQEGKRLERGQGDDPKAFREALRDHAAGFLSPLILRIEIGWPSELLKAGLVLVDLPGVGVAGDVYKKETQRFVREKARAVVLVIDRAGPTDSVMELLRTTGYWDRLVLSSDDPDADPCALIFAVTRVDDVAQEEWYAQDQDEEGRRPRTKAMVYDEIREKLRNEMRKQVEHQLQSFVQTDASQAIKDGREAARQSLLSALQIHPVSAIEYRRLLAGNEDDLPFLISEEQSGIPDLSSMLAGLGAAQSERRSLRTEELTQRLARSLADQIDSIDSAWRSDRAADEAERIQTALQVILDAKNAEFKNRRSSFRTFLRQTVPEKIKVAVHEAKDEARKGVDRYLRGLRDAHWATLRAAVRRGGTFYGARHLNLPSDIALRFQDPVAAVWSQSLLKSIRKETYQLAADMRQMVDEICDWASAEEGAFVDEKVIDTQKRLVSGQVERLRDVGREAIDDLREIVKVKVVETIEVPIRKACNKFVEEGNDIGPGVKGRILELFRELSENATEAARKPTEQTLISNYETVNGEIRKAFDEWGNPLETACDAIAQRHVDRIRRSDSQRRTRVLGALDKLRSKASEFGGGAGGTPRSS